MEQMEPALHLSAAADNELPVSSKNPPRIWLLEGRPSVRKESRIS